jgi:serine/threonine protein kinase
MGLTPGSQLGPYEILSPIGAGGMGEVYRARDTKLHRDVTPDGRRFMMIKGSPPVPATRINVVLDWAEELKRLVPTK